MTNEELIPILEKRISNCEKRIEEVKHNPTCIDLGGNLTEKGIYWSRYWEGQLKAYKILLEDLKKEQKEGK